MIGLQRLIYSLWYFFRPPWDRGISPPELMDFIQHHPPGRAFDLGCGTGTNVITLARNGWEATGVDFAWPAIRLAREKARCAGVKADFFVDEVAHPRQVTGVFDLVLDIGCYHGLNLMQSRDYVRNLERLLSPTGTYLMYGFFKSPGSSGPGLSEESLALLMDRFYLIERVNGTERGWRPSAWFTFRRTSILAGDQNLERRV